RMRSWGQADTWLAYGKYNGGTMKSRQLALCALAAAVAAETAHSQQQQSSGQGLEEILVTATRREQNLQDVPISIVAVTGENLEVRGIDNLEEVSQGVPNVLITGGGG